MPSIGEFSRLLAPLLPAAGREDFPSVLVSMLKQLVPLDNAAIVVYLDENLPRIDYNDAPPDHKPSSIDTFVRGGFLLDPYYLAAKGRKQGFFRLNELVPVGFHDSEYYRIYYSCTGLKDECGYLVPLGERGFVNISLGRIKIAENFNEDELALLRDISPTIEALSRVHWQSEQVAAGEQSDIRTQLETALQCFGTSMLTDRECQMVNLILHGYSTNAISDRLEISTETVKLHRKNAYAKLDIGSQGELFHLFIDSLISMKSYAGGDTLIPYLSPAHTNAVSDS